MEKEEREELIFICEMRSNYSEEHLRTLSDDELEAIYNKHMNAGLEV